MDRMKTQSVLLSDDLTGAMDTGVRLAGSGRSAVVALDPAGMTHMAADLVIVSTESRNMPPEAAYRVVYDNICRILASGRALAYKKVDSTLRGNIGAELEALLNTGEWELIVLSPALPHNGRTVYNGFHYLEGKLLTESDLARDPFAPVTSAFIPDILAVQTRYKAGVVSLEDLREGKLADRINELYATGCRIAVVDAQSEQDLFLTAAALEKLGLRVLPCGSAGLFSALYGNNPWRIGARPLAAKQQDRCLPLLVVSGSPAWRSKLQIKRAAACGVELLRAEPGMGPEMLAEQAGRRLNEGRSLILDGAGEGKEEIGRQYEGKRQQLQHDSHKIQSLLAETVDILVKKQAFCGLFIFGGDTAVSLCRKLQAEGIRIAGEIEPGVPCGVLQGGECAGLPIATKAGGFGTDGVILQAIDYFQGGNQQ